MSHSSHDDISEILAGSLGGAAATVIEYPLDTIKVRLQDDGKRYKNLFHCIRHIQEKEGFLNGFFRGLPAPVIGAAFENAVLFLFYRSVVEHLQTWFFVQQYAQDREPLSLVAAGGAAGGIFVSFILTPADLIKCRMQVQNTLPIADRIYSNSIECAAAIRRKRGIQGLFRGHVAMMLRESIGCAFYFVTFQYLIRLFLKEGESFHDVTPLAHLFGGGCAGVAFWTTTYPIDAVKTKQQTMKSDYLKLNFRQSVRRLYRTEGLRGMFRGYGVTALRAFPGNAVLIAVYEQVNKFYELAVRKNRRAIIESRHLFS